MIRTWSRPLLLLAVGAALSEPPAHAQETTEISGAAQARRITLDEALRRLDASNLELTLSREEAAAARARIVSAGMLANPGLTATREQLSGGLERYHETVVSLGQTLEWGGARGARQQAARESAQAAEARLEGARLRLAFELHRAYVRAAVAEANLAALGEATEVFRRVEESGRARFAEGDISRYDRSRLQVERARYETLLAGTRLELEETARELTLLVAPDALGAPPLLPAEPLAELRAAELTMSLDAALASAVRRAEVRAAAAEVDAARAELSLVRRDRAPDVTLSAGYKEQAGELSGAVLGISLPIPLWNRNQGEIAEAEARLRGASARRALVLSRAQADIQRAWGTHRSLRERMRTLGETLLPESAGLLETARVAYAEGEMTLVQLLDAADAYRSARATVNQLLGDYLLALYDLRRSTGTLVEAPSALTTDATSR